MNLKLDIDKVHKNAILEYIYNKLDDEQLYSPFIDLELEKRIKYLCEDIYRAAYKDGQETEKLKKEEEKHSMKVVNIKTSFDDEEIEEKIYEIIKEQIKSSYETLQSIGGTYL